MNCEKKELLLYAVTDRSWAKEDGFYEQVEAALKGGVTFVQLREKNREEEALFEEACRIRDLCTRYKVPFVINDNVELAALVGADGVHVGQNDMEVRAARRRLGKDKIIGVSARTVEQALAAERRGADYLGVGAVFHTGSKADAREISHDTLRQICRAVSIPVVAIGGISRENVMKLSGSGVCGIAVISAVFAQPDVLAAARELKALAQEMIRKVAV